MTSRVLRSGPNLSRLPLNPLLPVHRAAPLVSGKLWIALVAAPVLLAGMTLAAQQPYGQQPQSGQQPQYGYGYGSQGPQPGYAKPQYEQPQPYAPQQQYPQQPYAQPQYGQEPQYGQQPSYAAPQPSPNEAYAPQGQPYADQGYAGAGPQQPTQPPLSPDQLEQLVAPIALYPDALLAQILTASTYPAQVAVADQWLQQMQAQGYGSPDQVAAGANAQSWDPSVKALTAVPQVLAMLDHNLQWTTQLGNAYFNQPQDLMQTVQVLRQRAQGAGNLPSTPQETVSQDQGAIELAPPSPEVVYVPTYNPWLAYGAPIAPYPGFSFLGALGSFFGTGLRFGAGIGMGAFNQTPFGLLAWGLNWLAHAVFFNHSTYFTHSASVADWGFPHGGARAYGGGWGRGGYGGYARPGQYARPGEYGRSNYARGGVQGYGRENNSYGRENNYDRGGAYARGNAYASNGAYGNRAYNREGQFNRGYASPAYNYGRSTQQAYNRPTPAFSHPQTYGGAYGSSAYGRSENGYAVRPGQSYAAPGRYTAPSRAYSASLPRSAIHLSARLCRVPFPQLRPARPLRRILQPRRQERRIRRARTQGLLRRSRIQGSPWRRRTLQGPEIRWWRPQTPLSRN